MGLGYIKKMFTSENDIYVELQITDERVKVKSEADINVELQSTIKRIPAKLRKPPMAY